MKHFYIVYFHRPPPTHSCIQGHQCVTRPDYSQADATARHTGGWRVDLLSGHDHSDSRLTSCLQQLKEVCTAVGQQARGSIVTSTATGQPKDLVSD